MSKNTQLYDDINDAFVDAMDIVLKKLTAKQQDKYQIDNYPNAEQDTSINCVICGGSYTLRSRFVHNRTKKHLKSTDDIKNYIFS